MRRHWQVFRTLRRRYALSRPRYSLRYWWYGGATFTMLLFTLLLVSTGLMYFYYQKCQIQSRELEKWRSGIKVPQQPIITRVTKPKEENIPGMPAPSKAKQPPGALASAEPTATTPVPTEPPVRVTPKVSEVEQARPERTPDTKKIASAPEARAERQAEPVKMASDPEARADRTPGTKRTTAPEARTPQPTRRILSAYDAPESAASSQSRSRPQAPAIRVQVPSRTQGHTTPQGAEACPRTGQDDIATFLQQRSAR